MIRLFGVAIIGAAAYFLLSGLGWSGARSVSVAAFVFVIGFALASALGAWDTLSELTGFKAVSESAALLLRALGIVYAAEVCGEVCRSLGASECACAIDIACRAELLLLVLPIFERLLTLSVSLL